MASSLPEKSLGSRTASFRKAQIQPLLAASLLAVVCLSSAHAQQRDTIPTQEYFAGIELLYEGRYKYAERNLRSALKGGIKTVAKRWIDSICYHAMLGEVYYHQGRLPEALEQFNYACEMFLQNPKWLLRVRFNSTPRALTNPRPLPWGRRTRTFAMSQLPSSMLIGLGQVDNSQVARQGGVLRQAQYWRINVIEVLRTTALAIRRRNELLGPLGPHNGTSRALVQALRGRPAPPNHWSATWIDLLLGLAQVGTGEAQQALRPLERSTLLQGKYDHRLTCVALLELGRLQMLAGDQQAAAVTLAESGYLAFYYDDLGVLDDAFRLGITNQLAAGPSQANPQLTPAAAWARRKGWDHLYARLHLGMSEQWMAADNWNAAATALSAGQARLRRDMLAGLLGNQSQYLETRIAYQQGRNSADALLTKAMTNQMSMSIRNLQISMINAQFNSRQLSARKVVGLYQLLLADPAATDWSFHPLETLAFLKSNHQDAFDNWLTALLSRKDTPTALEVSDLAKRRRYHQALAWGGRLTALRKVLAHGKNPNTDRAKGQRNDLLLRYPGYNQAQKAGQQAVTQLRAQWWPNQDQPPDRKLARAWKTWTDTISHREAMLRGIGLEHVAADFSYPPQLTMTQIKGRLQPGQALLVFHNLPGGMVGFLQTTKAHQSWNLGAQAPLRELLAKFLRVLGNHDANRSITADEITSTDYQEAGQQLYSALFQGSSIDLKAIHELIVIPDHLIWYVPIEGLPVSMDGRVEPMISNLRIRYAPTVGLALYRTGEERRRIQRTGLRLGNLLPGESDEERQEMVATLNAGVTGPIELKSPLPAPAPLVGSLLDTLVVLDDIEIHTAQPWSWSPLSMERSDHRSLEQWMALPPFGPQQILLPGMRTLAERGFKVSRRRKGKESGIAIPGADLFFASCGLMSSNAQTVLLSRWRVGGQSTLDLVREFLQELPHTSAADAWQRSVQLAMEMPIDPLTELRVKSDSQNRPLTAKHPFFWSGYLVVDTGAAPRPEEDPPAKGKPTATKKPEPTGELADKGEAAATE